MLKALKNAYRSGYRVQTGTSVISEGIVLAFIEHHIHIFELPKS